MHSLSQHSTFPCPISMQARRKAEALRLHQANPDKANRVYLNTLAVWAVNAFLQGMGFETDLDASDSQDWITASLSDTADLIVKDLGKLECCPVLLGAATVDIPKDVWHGKLAYVIVQFDQECRLATLLGFLPTVSTETLLLTKLQSLDQFLEYLKAVKRINLSQWLQGKFEEGWLTIQDLFSAEFSSPAIALRQTPKSSPYIATNDFTAGKLLNLSLQLETQPLLLLLGVLPQADNKVKVSVRLCSADNAVLLPAHVRLAIMNQSGKELSAVEKPSEQAFIQLLPFTLRSGTPFTICISYDETLLTEPFVA